MKAIIAAVLAASIAGSASASATVDRCVSVTSRKPHPETVTYKYVMPIIDRCAPMAHTFYMVAFGRGCDQGGRKERVKASSVVGLKSTPKPLLS